MAAPTEPVVLAEAEPTESVAHVQPSAASRWRRALPVVVVALAVVFDLWVLRAEANYAAPLNDSSLHESMVRWAAQRIDAGHMPLDGWFPDLDNGLPQFHHYQSLAHSITGAATLVGGVDRTFSWTLYLLLSFWPVAVYGAARVWGLSRWQAAGAALVSPLVVSAPSYGFEHGSYVWRGWGLFPQLWAMWTLPFAWALGWRAVARRGSLLAAATLTALTAALHFLTGYLAFAALAVWVLVRPSELLGRLRRAVAVAAGGLGLAAWVVVPVLLDRNWTHDSGDLGGTFWADSYGARQVMSWFGGGELFDAGRLAVVTALVVVGIVVAARRARADEVPRALLGILVLSLVLFSGRPTFGGWMALLPFSGELLLHRFVTGVHLAGIFLAGIGAAWTGRRLLELGARAPIRLPGTATLTVIVAAGVLALTPAWKERADFNRQGAQWLSEQRAADASDGADVAALVDTAVRAGAGRIYAGTADNWGTEYRVGQVPVYAELLNNDASGFGFFRRTLALSAVPSLQFDEANPGHYPMFNITHLLLPADRPPPLPATLVAMEGRHTLWSLRRSSYIGPIATVAPVTADRSTLGEAVAPFMASGLAAANTYPLVEFPGTLPGPVTLSSEAPATPPPPQSGVEYALPNDGRFGGRVTIDDPVGVVLLRATYHGRWAAAVDGRPVPTFMVAPAFVGVALPPGSHLVEFEYRSFQHYWLLALMMAATAALLRFGPQAFAQRETT